MTDKSPAFQYYPKDFLSDGNVIAQTYTERGVYWTLVSICWLEGSLPPDTKALAKLLSLPRTHLARLWPAIAPCFVTRDDGRLVHPRLEKERAKQVVFRERASKGGEARQADVKQARSTPQAAAKQAPSRRQAVLNRSTPIFDLQSSNSVGTAIAVPGEHPIREFLALHERLFTERCGQKPAKYTGKEAKIASQVIADRGESEARALLERFMGSRDEFIQRAGFGLNIFATQLNKLLSDSAAVPIGGGGAAVLAHLGQRGAV